MMHKDKANGLICRLMVFNVAKAALEYYESTKDIDPLILVSDLESSVSYTDDDWILSRIFNEHRTPEEALGLPHSIAIEVKECYKCLHPRDAEAAVMDAAKIVRGYILVELL